MNSKCRQKSKFNIRALFRTHRAAVLTVLGVQLLAAPVIRAQLDNFDGYSSPANLTAAGWILSEMAQGLTTTTLPATAFGKGLRIQANPVPGEAPAAAIWYRSTEYTNFYMAVDLVKWADTNQSIVLLARGGIGDDPGGASGYLLNYNVAQFGDTPTSPRQGELEISVLSPPFGTIQLASGRVTLVVGGAYRIVFQGVGDHFTALIFDLNDLTRPVIRLDANDSGSTYASGICGLMSFSRDDEFGATDVTLDNYEIGGSDPNPATVPALSHPVSGTPTIESRIPQDRFQNFWDPNEGITFAVKTYTTNIINAGATKVRLNGVDVSSQLILSGNATQVGGFLPPTVLSPQSVYSAQIEVQDVSGQRKSTNTFWFDTFTEAYLDSAVVKVIEAEDYNYSNGVYQLDPIPVSGMDLNGYSVAPTGVGYVDKHGIEGVDFHDTLATPEPLWAWEYRMSDPVGLSQGMFPEIEDANDPYGEYRYSDFTRSRYATNAMLEYVVHRTEPGEWLNYTRDFAPGNYYTWLRVASLGASEVSLDKVTGDPTVSGQITTNLGKYSIPNQFTRYNYRYIPLLKSNAPAVLHLSGVTTLRLTMGGTPGQDADKLAINYILFVPAPIVIHVLSSSALSGPFGEEMGAIVEHENRTIRVPIAGGNRFYRLNAETGLTIQGISVSGGYVIIKY